MHIEEKGEEKRETRVFIALKWKIMTAGRETGLEVGRSSKMHDISKLEVNGIFFLVVCFS